MWSPDRRSLVLAGLAALAGCGFRPSFGTGAPATRLLNRIQFAEPAGREGYVLVRQLETRLGRASAPDLRLEYAIGIYEEAMGITSTNTTSRFNLVGNVTFTLSRLGTGEQIAAGKVDSFTGYSATGSTVATRAANDDARDRLMVILADQLTTRLIALAPSLPA